MTATNLGLLRANIETSYSVRIGPGGEKFSDGEILKTTTMALYNLATTAPLPKVPVQSDVDIRHSITSPDPQ